VRGKQSVKEYGDVAGEGNGIGRQEAAATARRAKKWARKRLGGIDSELDFDGHKQ